MNFTFLPSSSVLIHTSSGIFVPLQPGSVLSSKSLPCSKNGLSLLPSSPEQCADYLARRKRGSRSRCSLFFYCLPGAIRGVVRFISRSRADFAMRGFAISFLTLARVASPNAFLVFFFIEHP